VRLLGLVGSLRKGSWNRALLRAIGDALPDGAVLHDYDRLGDLPLFDPDVAGTPEPVAALKAAITAADGLVIVSPEYNYSISGVLKNAIDWASRPPTTSPLRGKPAAVASASIGMSGGMRAQYHLRQILVYTDTPVMAQPEVIIPHVRDRFDAAGVLHDASTRDLVTRFGAALVTWVGRFGGGR
jgi:chromate reductase, NAD(P)H dehydrogenase (quinone)